MAIPYTLLGGTQRRYLPPAWREWTRARPVQLAAVLTAVLLLTVVWNARPARIDGLATTVAGHAGGFHVLTNVGLRNRTFYFFNSTAETHVDAGSMMTGTTAALLNDTSFRPDVYFPGTTLFLNEGATSQWNGLWHYYHFAVENILSGLATLALQRDDDRPVMPDRLVIPWVTKWHDKWTMNDHVVDALWGQNVISKDQWEKLSTKNVLFEELVLIDRWAAHRTDPIVEQWLKMPIVVFQDSIDAGRRNFWDMARNRVHQKFKTEQPSGKQRVAYIDRQLTDRKLTDPVHFGLLEEMRKLVEERDDVEFDHMLLEKMSPDEQFRRASLATIVVGIHGNGLSHLIWLPKNSAVIELFPRWTFLRDYQSAAEVLGHDYTALRGDTIFTPAEWNAHPGNFNASLLHDGTTRVNTSLPLIMDTVRKALDDRRGR